MRTLNIGCNTSLSIEILCHGTCLRPTDNLNCRDSKTDWANHLAKHLPFVTLNGVWPPVITRLSVYVGQQHHYEEGRDFLACRARTLFHSSLLYATISLLNELGIHFVLVSYGWQEFMSFIHNFEQDIVVLFVSLKRSKFYIPMISTEFIYIRALNKN